MMYFVVTPKCNLSTVRYFPAPYSSGGPDFQLKALVLFAKASLELLCQVHLLPSVYAHLPSPPSTTSIPSTPIPSLLFII